MRRPPYILEAEGGGSNRGAKAPFILGCCQLSRHAPLPGQRPPSGLFLTALQWPGVWESIAFLSVVRFTSISGLEGEERCGLFALGVAFQVDLLARDSGFEPFPWPIEGF